MPKISEDYRRFVEELFYADFVSATAQLTTVFFYDHKNTFKIHLSRLWPRINYLEVSPVDFIFYKHS